MDVDALIRAVVTLSRSSWDRVVAAIHGLSVKKSKTAVLSDDELLFYRAFLDAVRAEGISFGVANVDGYTYSPKSLHFDHELFIAAYEAAVAFVRTNRVKTLYLYKFYYLVAKITVRAIKRDAFRHKTILKILEKSLENNGIDEKEYRKATELLSGLKPQGLSISGVLRRISESLYSDLDHAYPGYIKSGLFTKLVLEGNTNDRKPE